MTDYKNIRGKKIKFFTTDLSSEQSEGQLFYSDTDNQFKTVIASQAWSSTGAMVTGTGFGAHSGPTTNSFYVGGLPVIATTQHYNGTGWSVGADFPSSLYGLASAGTQTAGLAFAGEDGSDNKSNASVSYDGSSWTATPNLNSARGQTAGTGTQTSALLAGGRGPGGAAMVTSFEEWNGSSWSALPAIGTARGHAFMSGPETATFIAGGGTGDNSGTPVIATTEEYDGSSLSTGGNLNTARYQGGSAGNSGDGLVWAGASNEKNTEQYNGTSWTETSDLASTHRGCGNGAGSISNSKGGICAGAYPAVTTSEEWNITVNTVTGAAWASGGNMNQDRYYMQGAGAGPQTAALGAGGYGPSNTSHALTEEYNGTSWSEVNNLPRGMGRLFGLGTQTAAIFCGGFAQPNTMYNETWEYDGTNWSEGGDMNTARGMGINFGTQTAGLIGGGGNFGGSASVEAEVEEYNGTAWTEVNNIPNATRNNASFGTQTAGVVTQGKISPNGAWPGTNTNVSFEYDGTNWTAAAAGLVTGPAGEGVGTLTDGGTCGNNGGIYQRYDGTTWRTDARTASNGGSRGTSGTAAAAIAFAGFDDPNILNATEEFTAETTALNIKTLTDS